MGDEESLRWFNARIKYAISRNEFDLYEALYLGKYRYVGGNLSEIDNSIFENKKIIIYGAHACHILKNSKFSERIIAFLDSNPEKWGKKYCGSNNVSVDIMVYERKDN